MFYRPSILRFFVLLIFVIASNSLQAHSRGESYSKWYISEQGAEIIYTLALKDISQLSEHFQGSEPGWQDRVRQHIQNNTQLFDNDIACSITTDFSVRKSAGYLQIDGQYRCNSSEKLKIINNSIFDLDSRHMHILRINFADGDIKEKVLLNRDREWPLYADGESGTANEMISGSTFLNYFFIGIEHIASGWDHLAFLAAICLILLLMQASRKTLILIISGFTIGHSISLILSVLGYLKPNGLVVESLIAFSIALLAIESIAFKTHNHFKLSLAIVFALVLYMLGQILLFESAIPILSLLGLSIFVFCYFNLSKQSNSTLPQLLLTLLFGLVHGFGFAGSLQDIGLPQDRLILALVSFNLGVEFGQLIIVAVGLLLFARAKQLFQRMATLSSTQTQYTATLLIEICAAFLCALGTFWFIERSIL